MRILAALLVALVALEHLALAALETYFWTRPLGLRVSGLTPEAAQASMAMARSQGAYNALLAGALLWTFLIRDARRRRNLRIVLLFGVLIAAGFSGAASPAGFFLVQGVPALVTFAFVRFSDEWGQPRA